MNDQPDFNVETSTPARQQRSGQGAYIERVLGQLRQSCVAPTPDMKITADIATCAQVMIDGTPAEAKSYVRRLLARGLTIEVLFEQVFPQISVHLGLCWSEDRVSFAETTLAYLNLQATLHEFRHNYIGVQPRGTKGRVLLATLPGEPHLFGMLLFSCYTERAGIAVSCEAAASTERLLERLEEGNFDALGFSCGGGIALDSLETTVKAIRDTGCTTPIMVGGMLTALHGRAKVSTKVDFWASDITDALHYMKGLRQHELQAVCS